MFFVRQEVLRLLEQARQEKIIGKGLDADVQIFTTGHLLALLKMPSLNLKEFLNVSDVKVFPDPDRPVEFGSGVRVVTARVGPDLTLVVLPASGRKCARCWNFMPEVSNYGVWENVCTRCQAALREMHIPPPQREDVA